MRETIADLLSFVSSGRTESRELLAALEVLGDPLRLRLVAIKLLAWLKLQARIGKPRPLELNAEYEWCQDLLLLLQRQAFLRGLVEVSQDAIGLRQDLPPDLRAEILKLVDAEYHPRLMTKEARS